MLLAPVGNGYRGQSRCHTACDCVQNGNQEKSMIIRRGLRMEGHGRTWKSGEAFESATYVFLIKLIQNLIQL